MIVTPKKIDNLCVYHFQSNFTSQSSYHNHNLTSLLGIFLCQKMTRDPPAPPSKLHAVSNDEGGTLAVPCGCCPAQECSKHVQSGVSGMVSPAFVGRDEIKESWKPADSY